MRNKEDGCTGAFFEGRFKSIAVLDEKSLLATCAQIELNPVAAGLAATPDDSPILTDIDDHHSALTAEMLG